MYPERFRQRDDSRASIALSGPYGGYMATTGSAVKNLGSAQVIYDMLPKKPYVKTSYNLNQCEIRCWSASCTSGRVVFLPRWYGDTWGAVLDGQIAGLKAYPSLALIPTPVDSRREQIAMERAYAAITTPKVDIGMMMAELPETFSMLASPMKSLVKIMSSPKAKLLPTTRDISQLPRKYADKATSAWLGLRYGIMPLISDIQGIRKLIEQKSTRDLSDVITETAGSTYGKNTTIVETQETTGLFTGLWRSETSTSNRTLGKVYFRNYVTGVGAGLYDIPSLVWELIPYSFVVDWFLDVGGWLRRCQPTPGIIGIGCTVSTKCETSFVKTNKCMWRANFPQSSNLSTSSMYNSLVELYTRTPSSFSTPYGMTWNSDWSRLNRVVDGLSLIWQQMPRR